MDVDVIVNERASGSRRAAALPELLAARGIGVSRFELVRDGGALRKAVRRAVKRDTESVLVGGGDGTMAIAVDVLAHTDGILGVLPLGTGNSFARTLGLPFALADAVRVVADGRHLRVDLGTVDGRHFANFATVGMPAAVANATPHALKRAIGPLAYVVAGLAPFWRHRPFRARLKADDGRHEFDTHQLVIASGRFFGRRPVMPGASICDGKLAVSTSRATSRAAVARTYAAFVLGKQTELPDAVAFETAELVLRATPRQPVSIDGNPCGRTPVRFGIARRALRVYVPLEFEAACDGRL